VFSLPVLCLGASLWPISSVMWGKYGRNLLTMGYIDNEFLNKYEINFKNGFFLSIVLFL
jgi:hypothetical protein